MSVEFDQRAYRHALGHFPTGVVVVTAQIGEQEPIAMTVSSFNSVSLDPPLILFSVGKKALSLPVLLAAETFGVSVLDQTQQEVSRRFAGGLGDKWNGFTPDRGLSGCPLIGASLAAFECSRFAVHEGGDHLIVIGRVEQFEIAPEGAPLVFFRGQYHALAAQA